MDLARMLQEGTLGEVELPEGVMLAVVRLQQLPPGFVPALQSAEWGVSRDEGDVVFASAFLRFRKV